MKRTLLVTILGLTAAVSALGQSRILLDTYGSSLVEPYPLITWGTFYGGGPVNGHTIGSPVSSADHFTVGLFYSITPATIDDPFGYGSIPSPFVLATGPGSTTTIQPTLPGLFTSSSEFVIPQFVSTAYLVVVVYNGADYYTSSLRAHSPVFTFAPNNSPFGPAPGMGSSSPAGQMQPFVINVIPEPSTISLVGMGLASLLIFRRRR